jgi:hypothetical protein
MPQWLTETWRSAVVRAKEAHIGRLLWERVFTPAEHRRLGTNLDKAYEFHGSPVAMWRHLYGVTETRAVIDINYRLNLLDAASADSLLREFDEMPQDPDLAREWAVGKKGLVLVDTEREAHWKGEYIEVDWHRHSKSWVLLWEIARAAKRKQTIDETVFGDKQKGNLKSSVFRLKQHTNFPASLADRILPVILGNYQLALRPTEIHLFELGGVGSVREYKP